MQIDLYYMARGNLLLKRYELADLSASRDFAREHGSKSYTEAVLLVVDETVLVWNAKQKEFEPNDGMKSKMELAFWGSKLESLPLIGDNEFAARDLRNRLANALANLEYIEEQDPLQGPVNLDDLIREIQRFLAHVEHPFEVATEPYPGPGSPFGSRNQGI